MSTGQQRGAPTPQTQALAQISPIETSTQAIALVPQSLDGAMQLARWLATSQFLPDKLRGKEADVFCLVLAGAELGLPPMAALRGLYTVNGRTAMESKTKAAICIQRGAALYFRRTEHTPVAVTWETLRRGEVEPRTQRYTRQEAEAAGLLRKEGPWQSYTQRMLSHRALGWLCDDAYPDVVLGVATAEDFADGDDRGVFQALAQVAPGVDIGRLQAAPTAAPTTSSAPAKPQPPEDKRPALTEDDVVDIIEQISRVGTELALREIWKHRISTARMDEHQRARLGKAYTDQLTEIKRAVAAEKGAAP